MCPQKSGKAHYSNNELLGGAGNDTLDGGIGGDDFLDGGIGQDRLIGGSGNDYYVVDDLGDIVIDTGLAEGSGYDTVESSANFSLNTANAAGVEGLVLTGNVGRTGTGNSLNNLLIANDAGCNLSGLDGDDDLIGGLLKDTLNGGAGADILVGGAGNDALYGSVGNDTYVFGAGDGQDGILDADSTVGNTDTLTFTGSISANQLWFRQVSTNLEVSVIGTSDKVTILGWYLTDARKIEQFEAQGSGQSLSSTKVDALVSAMVNFTPPAAGQTTLPANYQTALNNVIATNWV